MHFMRFIYALLSLFTILVYATSVKTSNGLILGHKASNVSQVVEYLGIPYAQPPTGDLRSCPVAPPSPSRPYPNANAQFPKIIAAFTGSIDENRSEDCLTLNIWAKDTSAKRKPVVIYFYGGRYTIGTSHTPFYNGQYLASATDIIVVTVNFRINIFGFPGAPNNTQNLGFLDQRLAVEWVRDNIHGFGGNPNHIVIAGQSSASVAVDYWSYSHVNDPIVKGYIEHSGDAFSFGLNSNDVATAHWYEVSEALGCGGSGDTLPCMRAVKNVTAIEAAAAQVKPPLVPGSDPARPPPTFQPTPDGVSVFDDYKARSDSGNFSRLPYLIGQTSNEAGYYKIPAYSANVTLPQSAWDHFNLADFTCPASFTAQSKVNHHVPVYRFVYFGDWDNLRLYPDSGAYHGSDVEMVFGGSLDVSGLPKSTEEVKMEMVMMKAWAAFVEQPDGGLERTGWPRYEGMGTETLVRLGDSGKGELRLGKPEEWDVGCENVTISG
ncbi:uncharacterized protein KY384_005689 [Bacidia gigantensis]|uniref:uncharacterized protein n=1 Tax=Bacidia gigantensis TaxID=2732470 RepID=UPI001D05BA8A|nr:uncharacterized protein KY384_005689 [Bacidia gigantensis]KAG8529054.1 hypothetical protein KY384_005689 [Bacidia gigantensis]